MATFEFSTILPFASPAELVKEAERIAPVLTILDQGKLLAKADTHGSFLARLLVTFKPDRQAFQAERKAERESKTRSFGILDAIKAVHGTDPESWPASLVMLAGSRSGQARFSQIKDAYEDRPKAVKI